MKTGTRLSPPNSLILIMDQSVGEIPESMDGGLVAATPSCVAVGTLSEHDGETLITISNEIPASDLGLSIAFDGQLNTPTKNLQVCSVNRSILVEAPVLHSITEVQIWTNDSYEPDNIYVLILDNT